MKTMDMAINQRDAQLLAKGERTTELLNVLLKVDPEEYLAAESDALMIRSDKVPWVDPAKSSFDKKRVKLPDSFRALYTASRRRHWPTRLPE